MKRIYTSSLFVIVCLALFAILGCKKPVSKQAQYLPKDAVYVMSINGGSIKEKLKDEAFSLGNLLSTITQQDSVINKIKEKLDAFKNAGIDLEAPIYMALRMNNNNDMEVMLAAAMKNTDDFESFLKKSIKNITVQKADDITYVDDNNGLQTNGDGILGWNKNAAIFSVISKNNHYDYDTYTDTSTITSPPSKDNPNTTNSNTALDRLKKILNQKEDESLLSISEFKSLQQEKSDATLWLNISSITAKMPMKFPKMKTLLENNYLAATINFNDGEVVLDGKSYAGKELGEIYKKYAGPTVDLDLLKHYPSNNNLNGFAMLAFKPAIVNEIMKTLGVDGLVNVFLIQAGLTLEDITKAFKGDIMVAASDFTMKQVQSSYNPNYSYLKPETKWLLNIPFGDKAAVDKLMNALITKQLIIKQGNKYVPTSGNVSSTGISLNIDDKGIIVASDSIVMQQYMSGTGKTSMPSDVQSMIKDKAFALYIDIDKLLTSIPTPTNEISNDITQTIVSKSKALFKDAIIVADNYNGTYMKHKWVLRLKDQKENSIKQLYKYVQTLIESAMKMYMMEKAPVTSAPLVEPTTNTTNTEISPKADDYEKNTK